MNWTRLVLSLVVIIGVVGTIWYKFNSLEGKLDEANTSINTLRKTIETKTVLIANRDNAISTLDASILDLTTSIDTQNNIITKKNELLQASKLAYTTLLEKPDVIKYKYLYKTIIKPEIVYEKATCAQCLDFNKEIAKVDYDKI